MSVRNDREMRVLLAALRSWADTQRYTVAGTVSERARLNDDALIAERMADRFESAS